MLNSIRNIYAALLLTVILSTCLSAQTGSEKQIMAKRLFEKIETALSSGSASELSEFIGGKIYLSLTNGTSGYYTANQAYYILKDFFALYIPGGCRFNSVITRSSSPFASGSVKYVTKGVRGTAQVFVSLLLINEEWKIAQITIN